MNYFSTFYVSITSTHISVWSLQLGWLNAGDNSCTPAAAMSLLVRSSSLRWDSDCCRTKARVLQEFPVRLQLASLSKSKKSEKWVYIIFLFDLCTNNQGWVTTEVPAERRWYAGALAGIPTYSWLFFKTVAVASQIATLIVQTTRAATTLWMT